MIYDYYSILEISSAATIGEIKKAYRLQAHKWHPDKNLGQDTVKKMQDINEAYLILSDKDARSRYDIEYRIFFKNVNKTQERHFEYNPQEENYYSHFDHEICDSILNDWINKARSQAKDLSRLSLDDIFGITNSALKGSLSGALQGLICVVLVFIFLSVFYGIR